MTLRLWLLILADNGFGVTDDFSDADLILINTCSIREKAEDTIRRRLKVFRQAKDNNPEVLVGVLGCMAERLKQKLLEQEKTGRPRGRTRCLSFSPGTYSGS